MPIGSHPDEVEIIEVSTPFPASTDSPDEPMRIRVDTVPATTIARSPGHAAAMAIAMQRLSNAGAHQLGFTVDYFA